jgi:hypothetical protein
MKRTKLLRRSPIRKSRAEARPGRLKGKALTILRVDTFAAAKARCQICGRPIIFDAPREWDNSYHMAHIGAKRRYGDSRSNTRAECGQCHREFHQYGPSRTKPCPKKEREEA